MSEKQIKLAICGIGNCASSLIQGISRFSTSGELTGLKYRVINGYKLSDVQIVAAFDIDNRKVGKDVSEAIFESPNNTLIFQDKIEKMGVIVQKGPTLDGIAPHTGNFPENQRIVEYKGPDVDVVSVLRESGAEIFINYLPVGSQVATEFYANACLEAGVHFINAIPVFIASDEKWRKKFSDKGLCLIGDDIKSQVGATIVHRLLSRLFNKRGVDIEKTYQLNVGGNTDFLNMKDNARIISKKVSKTQSVRSQISSQISDDNVHIGPSDYVPWLKDNKVAFIRLEGFLFGGAPIELDVRLSVEDSPNSAGVMVDVIRFMKLAIENKNYDLVDIVSAYGFKSPRTQMSDEDSWSILEKYVKNNDNIL
jgi:myo-inositol-1-phosphate synthase